MVRNFSIILYVTKHLYCSETLRDKWVDKIRGEHYTLHVPLLNHVAGCHSSLWICSSIVPQFPNYLVLWACAMRNLPLSHTHRTLQNCAVFHNNGIWPWDFQGFELTITSPAIMHWAPWIPYPSRYLLSCSDCNQIPLEGLRNLLKRLPITNQDAKLVK